MHLRTEWDPCQSIKKNARPTEKDDGRVLVRATIEVSMAHLSRRFVSDRRKACLPSFTHRSIYHIWQTKGSLLQELSFIQVINLFFRLGTFSTHTD